MTRSAETSVVLRSFLLFVIVAESLHSASGLSTFPRENNKPAGYRHDKVEMTRDTLLIIAGFTSLQARQLVGKHTLKKSLK